MTHDNLDANADRATRQDGWYFVEIPGIVARVPAWWDSANEEWRSTRNAVHRAQPTFIDERPLVPSPDETPAPVNRPEGLDVEGLLESVRSEPLAYFSYVPRLCSYILALEADRAELELELRKTLWLNHGHDGLYGDDGEMQCNLGGCMLDFKRAPLPEIYQRLWINRMREARAARKPEAHS